MSEPFWDEQISDSPGGGGGSGWGGGGDGGGGGSGWGGSGGDKPPTPPQWSEVSFPLLKINTDGLLLTDWESSHLLIGSISCTVEPHVIIQLNGRNGNSHCNCVLWRYSGDNQLQFSGDYAYLSHLRPGEYSFEAKFQSGHWDYSEISGARFIVFGVDLGFLSLPLREGQYRKIFTVQITEGLVIYVNNIRGSIHGNGKIGV